MTIDRCVYCLEHKSWGVECAPQYCITTYGLGYSLIHGYVWPTGILSSDVGKYPPWMIEMFRYSLTMNVMFIRV